MGNDHTTHRKPTPDPIHVSSADNVLLACSLVYVLHCLRTSYSFLRLSQLCISSTDGQTFPLVPDVTLGLFLPVTMGLGSIHIGLMSQMCYVRGRHAMLVGVEGLSGQELTV